MIIGLAGAMLAAGCAHIPSGVNVTSIAHPRQAYSEKFPAAFISRGSGGDFHIVLLKDDAGREPKHDTGAPIQPLALGEVRQVMDIHIFWQPMRETKPDNPSATNAAIDWYLVRAGEDGKITGLAEYKGAGLVTASLAEDSAGVLIRSGTLQPTRVEGDISDPIGTMKITGRFDVVHRPVAVTDVLRELDKLKTSGVGGPVDAVKLTEPAASARVP
ncbi:MAG TPA: hypothetical protein VFE58_18765 [Tepidisphaeraceae bacterium]|jgi:hypothetical protein|nr:hypothetical protein [Tepidisphaeraceae bacterium]